MTRYVAFLFSVLSLPLLAASETPEPRSIHLILDCSASMWNKLEDGRYRIDGAKAALLDFLSTTPEDPGLHVGLRIYGAKVPFSKPGACEDSELVIPIDGFRRAEMMEAVKKARAIGATPLARSLNLAREDFSKPGKRYLIVCTDGEESCGGDVAEAIRALQASGVEVDVRIIGLGLPQAAAERFAAMGVPVSNVNSTEAFADALSKAVEPAVAETKASPKPVTITLRLVKNGQPAAGYDVQLTHTLSGDAVALRPGDEGSFSGSALPGPYRAKTTPGDRTFEGLAVAVDTPAEFVLDLTEAPTATLSATPKEVPAGQPITIHFEGAAGIEDEWIGLVPVEEPDGVQLSWADTDQKRSGKITLNAPMEPGTYEARLHTKIGDEDVVSGKSNPVIVQRAKVILKAPAKVPAASVFLVEWQGPAAEGDWIGVCEAGSADTEYLDYSRPQSSGEPLSFVAPSQPGKYEIRYSNDQARSIFGRAAFEVVSAEFAVTAPATAMAGESIPISWTANVSSQAFITIVPATAPDDSSEKYFYMEDSEMPQLLTAPREEGAAEVRMVSGDGKILAKRSLRLTAPKASIQSPASGKATQPIEVSWTGPAGQGDFVTVVEPSAEEAVYGNYFSVSREEPKELLNLPETPGTYEIRYVTGENRILARVPIRVEN